MTFPEFAKEKRSAIEKTLLVFLQGAESLHEVSPWGEDVRNRFVDFVSDGKLLRGSLVLLGYEMYGGNNQQDALVLASAIELFHSSLLIHDDLMDQDQVRRGKPTFSAQYNELANDKQLKYAKRTGESLATCAGDIGFFLGFSLLNKLSDQKKKTNILELVSKELTLVGLGQMQDVALGASNTMPSEEEILSVYRYKTARYTFSLPLVLGAILAGADEEDLRKITKLGESVGIIYQIKDDELNLFGDENKTGKPVGSDIREGKKTLYYVALSKNKTQSNMLVRLFGKKDITNSEMAQIRDAVREEGIEAQFKKRLGLLAEEYLSLVKHLTIADVYKPLLINLLEYSLQRNS